MVIYVPQCASICLNRSYHEFIEDRLYHFSLFGVDKKNISWHKTRDGNDVRLEYLATGYEKNFEFYWIVDEYMTEGRSDR